MRKGMYGALTVMSVAVILAGCGAGVSGGGDAGLDNEQTNVTSDFVEGDSLSEGREASAASDDDGLAFSKATEAVAKADANAINDCGIYIYNESTGMRELVDGVYLSKWEKGKDIMCFEVFNSSKSSLSGSTIFKYLWEPIWFGATDAINYRIGYEVQFSIDGGATKVDQMLLMPEDTEKYKSYMEFYMYDDYHQTPGVWYSHVEQSAYDDSTLLTSIKFTAGQKYDQISGDVTLTAFLYNPSTHCFDADGHYTGNLKYTITVQNAK